MTTRRALVGAVLAACITGCKRTRSAADILDDAKADAQRSRRAIFAMFYSSW